jgi:hypothetical protein
LKFAGEKKSSFNSIPDKENNLEIWIKESI